MTPAPNPLWKRIGWFVALYILGVLAVGIVAYGLRLWIKPAPRTAAVTHISAPRSA